MNEQQMRAQGPVRRIHDPSHVGILTGEQRMRGDRRYLQVRFSSGTQWVAEDQLEPGPSTADSPSDLLLSCRLSTPADLRRTLVHAKLSGRLADVIYSMEATNTDFYAYQFKPVIKLLESPARAILIADEVGLGKTIEAGLIWTELQTRFDKRRLLVLCPAALREKWRDELMSRMGLDPQIVNAKQLLGALRNEEHMARGFALIGSLQGLRPPRDWEDGDNSSDTAQLARFLVESRSGEGLIDMLVIDEAHHLRTRGTLTSQLGTWVREVSDYAVLLSATPIHNTNRDLFQLLSLLDPDTFSRDSVFSQILEANRPLVEARDLILRQGIDREHLLALLRRAQEHDLLSTNRQLHLTGSLSSVHLL